MIQRSQLDAIAEAHGGIPVYGCLPGSPAHRAGIRYGDILLECNGQPADRLGAYLEARNLYQDRVELKILRAGEEMELTLDLGASESPPMSAVSRYVAESRAFAPVEKSEDDAPLN